MKKICSKCGNSKDEKKFAWKHKAKGIRGTKCRDCVRAYCKSYYDANKATYIKKNLTRKQRLAEENRDKLADYLVGKCCKDCKNDDPRVFHFDHVKGDKILSISAMLYQGYTWETIEREIAKCEIRCANCHLIKTATERGWNMVRRPQ